jgi:hypothetical protein
MHPEVLLLFVAGAVSAVFGAYTISRRAFPAWMTGPWLWPMVRVTPEVAVAEGTAALFIGLASLTYPFVRFAAPEQIRLLTALTLIAAFVSVVLVVLSVWLSRRPEPAARPGRP